MDQLRFDPKVLEAAEAYARETGQPRELVQKRVEKDAREIVPAFNAWVYFRAGYAIARAVARSLYRVRLGTADDAGLRAIPRGRDGRLRHEPPEQHGLLPPVIPRGRKDCAELRGRRVGADLAHPGLPAGDRRVLRAARFEGPALSARPRALGRDGDRERGPAGRLSGGRPLEGRRPPPAEARPSRLHAPRLRPEGPARPRLHPRRRQLRPRPRGPHAPPRPLARRRGRRRRATPSPRPCASSGATRASCSRTNGTGSDTPA